MSITLHAGFYPIRKFHHKFVSFTFLSILIVRSIFQPTSVLKSSTRNFFHENFVSIRHWLHLSQFDLFNWGKCLQMSTRVSFLKNLDVLSPARVKTCSTKIQVHIEHYLGSSVTRWLKYLFNIWPFRTTRICPIA